MSKSTKRPGSKFIKGAVIFFLATFLFQICMTTLMTTDGAAGVYPYYLALKTEKIDTDDMGVGEYYPLKDVAENSDLIVLAIDEGVADSYVLGADFLNFLEKFAHISAVALYAPRAPVSIMSEYAVSGDRESFTDTLERQREIAVMSNEMLELIDYCYGMNSRLAPENKMPLIGIRGLTSSKSLMTEISNEIYITPGAATKEHMELLSAKDTAEFTELFKKYESSLREVFGDDYDKYAVLCDAMEDEGVAEVVAAQNLIKYRPEGEGAVFAVMPRSMCDEGSYFLNMAEEAYGRVTVVRCSYYDCETFVDEAVHDRDDGPYPFFFDGIRIASAKKLEGFRGYYASLCRGLDESKREVELDRIGEAGERSFFVICGSGAVSYGIPETEETATDVSSVTDTES